MKNKQLFVLLGILGVLVILVLISGRKPKPKIEPLFPQLQTDQVAKIEILKQEQKPKEQSEEADEAKKENEEENAEVQTTVLQKEGGKWVVATRDNYPADEDAVDRLLKKVSEFKTTLLEATNPKFHEKYGVDSSGLQVKLSDADGKLLAHFYVGRAESDYMNTYVRREGSDKVYRIPESLMSTFDKGTRGWRDRSIFKFEDTEISKLAVTTESESYVLEADRSSEEVKWSIIEPESAPAKKDVVERMASSLASLQTDDFPETQDLKPEDTGLDNPTSKVEATLTDGTTRTLLIGKKKEDSSQYYVQRADKDTIFLLYQWRVNQLLKKLEDIKEKPKEEAQEGTQEQPSAEAGKTPKEEAKEHAGENPGGEASSGNDQSSTGGE